MPSVSPELHHVLDALGKWRLVAAEENCPDLVTRRDVDRFRELTNTVIWYCTDLYPGGDPMIFDDAFRLIIEAKRKGLRPVPDEVTRAIDRACFVIQRIEATIIDKSATVTGSLPAIRVDTQSDTITLGQETHAVSHDQAMIVDRLVHEKGGWVPGKNLPAARADRIVARLPEPVKERIQSKQSAGYRILF